MLSVGLAKTGQLDFNSDYQHAFKGRSQNFGLPDKSYCTVCYTVPFLRCNQLKFIDIPAATNSSKA